MEKHLLPLEQRQLLVQLINHTFIDHSFKLKDGSNERLQMDANGIQWEVNFLLNADGTATFGGTLTIGNMVSSSAQLADAISGSSNEFSAFSCFKYNN